MDGPVRATVDYRAEAESVFSLRKRFLSDQPKESKSAKLRQNLLHLFATETEAEPLATILLDGAVVDLFPEDLTPNELWSPSFPIRIVHATRSLYHGSHVLYLFVPVGVDKESWMMALRHATQWSSEIMHDQTFMASLSAYTLSSPDVNVHLRWLNALVGRLFWSANSSQGANRFFRNKLDASLQRTLLRKGRPPFIDYIKVESLTAGDRLPVFTAGGAVDVSADGTLVALPRARTKRRAAEPQSMDVDVRYEGAVRVEVEAMASVDLPYTKRLTVPLVLSVTLRKLTGRLRFLIKAPPTDRFWVGFHERPTTVMEVMPVVAETTVKFDFVRSFLEKLLVDMLSVVMVLPNMDDYPLPVMVEADPAAEEPAASTDGPPSESTSLSTLAASSTRSTPTIDTGVAHVAPAALHPTLSLPLPATSAGDVASDLSLDDDRAAPPADGGADQAPPDSPMGRAAARHARELSGDAGSDGVEPRPASASSSTLGAIGAASSTGSLLDRTALSAAELRRRAVNVASASSSLAASVLSKANARLNKPGPASPPKSGGVGAGSATQHGRRDLLTEPPTASIDDISWRTSGRERYPSQSNTDDLPADSVGVPATEPHGDGDHIDRTAPIPITPAPARAGSLPGMFLGSMDI